MVTAQRSIRNLYRDSVSLMQFSEKIRVMPGIHQASAVMATENNISLLVEAGLLASPVPSSPNDLLIIVEGSDIGSANSALNTAEELLKKRGDDTGDSVLRGIPPRSLAMGLDLLPGANLALISTPGEYAAAEALKALKHGLHVMMFSDNVSSEDELMLKRYSHAHELLFMGPDCGTAIINGIPLGFANVVQSGDIGIVAASGTGLQQVSSLIDRFGGGISQALGTGGHDLSARVEAITMKQGIAALTADPATRIIVLVSKPPAPQVLDGVLSEAERSGKPVVIDFIGADPSSLTRGKLLGVRTLEDAARASVALSQGLSPAIGAFSIPTQQVVEAASLLQPVQKYVRGLFSGGTFCYETLLLLAESLGPVYSNIPLKPEQRLANVWKSQGHTAIDLGDDLFTQGRPHPMIDFRLRCELLMQEASDPETAVILLDVVLGYGSNMDPAGELIPAIESARQTASAAGRGLVVIGSVCGTKSDPQNLARQEETLRQAGVLLAESNAQAAWLAASIVKQAGG
jgi:FdrA protein